MNAPLIIMALSSWLLLQSLLLLMPIRRCVLMNGGTGRKIPVDHICVHFRVMSGNK